MNFYAPLEDKFINIWTGFVKTLPLLAIACIILVITAIVVAIVTRAVEVPLRRSALRSSLKDLLVTLLRVSVWIAGVLIAITIIFPSLTPAKLLTALGLGSVAVGLAFKDIFENFFAGVLLMLRRPMDVGDFIECGGVEGKVEHISVRETYIRQTDDQLVLVPNSYLFKNPLNVLTDKPLRRYEITVGIAYGERINQARDVIKKAIMALPTIDKQRDIEIYANDFNSSSLDFVVRWWSKPTPIDSYITKDEVVTAIKYALDGAGIEIPFPYRTLTFKQPLAVALDNKDTEHKDYHADNSVKTSDE